MTFTAYLLNIALVGLVLLQVRGRKLTVAGLLVPVVVTIWVASQFLHGIPTAGNDLVLEGGLAALGASLGILAGLFTRVRRDGTSAVAKAGAAAAALWVLGVGARMAFSLWVDHGGAASVTHFSASAHITSSSSWAAAFVLMAMAEVVGRTAVLYLKARHSGAVLPRGGVLALRAAHS